MANRVLVAGSINMDIVAQAVRYPEEGETVHGDSLVYFPGGKGANQAVAAAQAGAQTEIIGRVGDDSFGAVLESFLRERGVGTARVENTARTPSGTALIVVTGENNRIVIVAGANGKLSKADVDKIKIRKGDVLVSQFEIPTEATGRFFELGKKTGARTILNPAPAEPISPELLKASDIVILNESELSFLTGKAVASDAPKKILEAVRLICRKGQQWIVTLGSSGAVWIDSDIPHVVSGHHVKVVDTTGAGDCFVGVVAARLAGGDSLKGSISFANAAAALCVQKGGAGPSMPSKSEVEKFLRHGAG